MVFVRVVEPHFEMRQKRQEAPPEALDLAREVSLHLGERRRLGFVGFGADEFGHRLGLGEVHLAVHEGPRGKFSRAPPSELPAAGRGSEFSEA